MKKNYLLLFLLLLFTTKILAQNSDNPWAINFGYNGSDFNAIVKDQKWFTINNWNHGVNLGIYRSLNPSFNLGLNSNIGVFEKPADLFKTSRSLALDLGLQYKFANGYILKQDSWFDPYILGGLGFNSIASKTYGLFNYGLGMNFWLQENIGLNIQTAYNNLPNFENYLTHTAGLRYRFGAKDSDKDGVVDKKDACPDTPGLKTLNGCPDSDSDGIADKDDACPNNAGLANLQGCPDSDGDGIADKDDTCPNEKGLASLAGCPDSDGDGVADKNDTCPTVKGLANLAGCPDTDGDGIADKDDTCPNEKGSSSLGGCPDTDGDGIADKDDKCPNEAGVSSEQGCPEKKISAEEKVKVEQQLKMIAKKVQFETGKSVITKASLLELDKVLAFMNEYPGSKFVVEGHTDNVGVAANNLKLSQSRADAVKKYFTDKGISGDRITATGYGQTKPIANNATPAGKATNRRVEIHLAD
jgi:outer membrane protein OmpA-like peptidoglycan-associated protein